MHAQTVNQALLRFRARRGRSYVPTCHTPLVRALRVVSCPEEKGSGVTSSREEKGSDVTNPNPWASSTEHEFLSDTHFLDLVSARKFIHS